ncbi:MAG: amidohydrolase family protein [Parvibaculum sp.]|nr:amidohydrolase family protein [Parvibaculum sp.]
MEQGSAAQDIVLTNGHLVDGSGAPGKPASLRIEKGRIAAIGLPSDIAPDGAEIVDCGGKVIAPGFIDAHSHMEYFALSANPGYVDSFTAQGVTTFVAGNCGFSPYGFAPLSAHLGLLENSLFKAGCNRFSWSSYAEFTSVIRQLGVTQNMVHLVGHGSCRTSLTGFEARDLNAPEMDRMLALLSQAMEEGVAGVSLGLQYKPGIFARTDELEQVAQLVREHDKILSVHARAYSAFSGTYPPLPFGKPHNLKAIEDMLDIVRRTGVRLQFSHLIFAGTRTWKTVDRAIALFDRIRDEGHDVMFDMFPYVCGATLLNTVLPEWFMAAMPGALHNPLARARLRIEAELGFRLVGFGYEQMQLAAGACPEYDPYNGLFLPDIARKTGRSCFETMLDILEKSDAEARMLFYNYYSDEIIERLMGHEAALFCTDSWPEPAGSQNPAAFGAFPRFLQIARERGTLSLERAVHRMTGAAAARYRLEGRGLLKPGFAADIVVFDPARVADNTTPSRCDAAPSGIEHVFINGVRALAGGRIVRAGHGAGRLLAPAA